MHEQGYKVVLTGEGADEALAGYAWFKTQKIRELSSGPMVARPSNGGAEPGPGLDRRQSAHRPALLGIRGARTAQQDVYDFMGQARSVVYSADLWDRLAGHSAYDDLDITNDRFTRWHPLNQSLYVGYKVMLAGLLLLAKGDRVAMNSSVEARYPLLDDDVIAFCASIAPEYKLRGLTDKWLLRQVAARTLPARIANRPKTMFRASRSEAFFDPDRPRWVDQLLSPESLQATGWFDPEGVARERAAQVRFPADHPQADHHGPEPDVRHRDPALAPHLPGRRPLRAADLGASVLRPLEPSSRDVAVSHRQPSYSAPAPHELRDGQSPVPNRAA